MREIKAKTIDGDAMKLLQHKKDNSMYGNGIFLSLIDRGELLGVVRVGVTDEVKYSVMHGERKIQITKSDLNLYVDCIRFE